jgi:hypothetical protein
MSVTTGHVLRLLARVGDVHTDLFCCSSEKWRILCEKAAILGSQIRHSCFSKPRVPRKGAPRLKYPRGNTDRAVKRLSDIGANNTRKGGGVEARSDASTPMYHGRPCTLLGCMLVMGREREYPWNRIRKCLERSMAAPPNTLNSGAVNISQWLNERRKCQHCFWQDESFSSCRERAS